MKEFKESLVGSQTFCNFVRLCRTGNKSGCKTRLTDSLKTISFNNVRYRRNQGTAV